MKMNKDELIDIIRQEIEAVRSEMLLDLTGCFDGDDGRVEAESMLSCLGDIQQKNKALDRLRPEDGDVSSKLDVASALPTFDEGKPRKSQLEKLKTKKRQEKRRDDERRRVAKYGGRAVMDTLGIAESDDDVPASKAKHFKNCDDVPGNVAHKASTGEFAETGDKNVSRSLYFSCPSSTRRVDASGKAPKNVKQQGRGPNKNRGSGKYRLRDGSPKYESKHRGEPTFKMLKESFERWCLGEQQERQEQSKAKYTTSDLNRIEFLVRDELNKMLKTYGQSISDQQRAAFKNTSSLSDTKLSVFSNSFGYTSLLSWLKQSGAMDRLVKRIADRLDTKALGKPHLQDYQKNVKAKGSSFDDEQTVEPTNVDSTV